MKQNRISDEVILLFIILIGGILRFYDYSNLPLTHDELSALFRLDYSSFSELIEKGVKGDGHPAGVQVFLFYWTRIFGYGEFLFKLPFLLMGIASIPLAYLISKRWFNSTVGLLVATGIASLQFPVMYSQIARPYGSGLFFSLLMVLFWTRLLSGSKNQRILNSVGFVLSSAACTYNHHFSLLFAFIVGVTGIFYVNRETIRAYLLSLAAILLLYIPHLNIFFYQLNLKGLGWLAVPERSFILDYIGYIFHFNILVYLSVLSLVFIGVYRNKTRILRLSKFQIISLAWFLAPALIGYFYSRYYMPVVQYSTLIFSFPFLLIFLFSFVKHSSGPAKIIFVSLLLIVNISTLVWSRKHYQIFYKQPFKEFATLTRDFLDHTNPEKVSIVLNGSPLSINYYFSDINPGIDYISTFDNEISPVELRGILESENTEYLIFGGNQLLLVSLIREQYPNLVFRDFGFTYEYFIFSRGNEISDKPGIDDILFYSKLDSQEEKENWHNTVLNPVDDSTSQSILKIDSTREWGPTFEMDLTDITGSRHDFIDICYDFRNCDGNNGLIVCEIIKNGKVISWNASSVSDFCDPDRSAEWQKGHLSFRLSNVFKRSGEMNNSRIKVYYWNKEKENVILDNFTVQIREGNERVYALIERLN